MTTTNTQIQVQPAVRRSFIARVRAAFGKAGKDTRGAEFVEYLVLVAVVALAGIAIFGKIKSGLDTAAGNEQKKIQELGK